MLESKILGGKDVDPIVTWVASIGKYSFNEFENTFHFINLCTAFLVTSKHLASYYACKTELDKNDKDSYKAIRAFIGQHQLRLVVIFSYFNIVGN